MGNFRVFATCFPFVMTACADGPMRVPPAGVPNYAEQSTVLTNYPPQSQPEAADDASVSDGSFDSASPPTRTLAARLAECGVASKPTETQCKRVPFPINCSALRRSVCGDEAARACEALQGANEEGSDVAMRAFACMMQLRECAPCAIEKCAGVALAHACTRRETR